MDTRLFSNTEVSMQDKRIENLDFDKALMEFIQSSISVMYGTESIEATAVLEKDGMVMGTSGTSVNVGTLFTQASASFIYKLPGWENEFLDHLALSTIGSAITTNYGVSYLIVHDPDGVSLTVDVMRDGTTKLLTLAETFRVTALLLEAINQQVG